MLRILGDLWDLGIETYNDLEESIHNTLIRRKCMKIRIVRKCRNGNFQVKYFDQQLNCWLETYESESNIRAGIQEGVFVVDSGENNTTTTTDNSLLGQARANAQPANQGIPRG